MARFIKLPESLKAWKITSQVPERNDDNLYRVSKKGSDGSTVEADLKYITLEGEDYNERNINFAEGECEFLKQVAAIDGVSNYVDVAFNNNESKNRAEVFIITKWYKTLEQVMKEKNFEESDVVDFGIKMSSVLEKLESNNIFHGNVNPKNIFVTENGEYLLGGFSDFEQKIDDLTYVAPEIHKNEKPDFTTDIYSLGLIMYSMCNDGKIPFESDEIGHDRAVNRRFDGAQISAPKHGSEKLKSVIVIACQTKNSNRWKNASNIKNALTSIKEEETSNTPKINPAVVVPEKTDFEDNVFEEFDFDESEDTGDNYTEAAASDEPGDEEKIDTVNQTEENEEIQAEIPEERVSDENTAEDAASDIKAEENDSPEEVQGSTISDDNDISSNDFKEVKLESSENKQPASFDEKFGIIADSPDDNNVIVHGENSSKEEITEDVFDNAKAEKPIKNFRETAKEKDYGDYFDDEDDTNNIIEESEHQATKTKSSDNKLDVDEGHYTDFENDDFDDEITDEHKSSKNSKIFIVISAIVMIAALGFIAFCIINGLSGSSNNNNEETTSPASQTQATTENPVGTTAESTTAEPTTQEVTEATENSATITNVVGYGYGYAKSVLEAQGFTVQEGEYKYSDTYDAGYVIAQSPKGNTTASEGTIITLDISLGKQEPETTAKPTESSTQAQSSSGSSSSSSNSGKSNTYIFPNSDSAYLSRSQVSQLSRNELTLAINEIYARRGRIFQDESIREYFESKSWYVPRYTADEFYDNVTFNPYEQANLNLMVDERKERDSAQ